MVGWDLIASFINEKSYNLFKIHLQKIKAIGSAPKIVMLW